MPAFTSPAALRRLSRAGSLRVPVTTPAPQPTAATATSDSPAPDTPASPLSPTSPRPLSPLLQAASDSTVLKAVRAYERDRQRARKTKERTERARERHERAAAAAAATATVAPAPDAHGSGRRVGCAPSLKGLGPKADVDAMLTLTAASPGTPFVEEVIADVVERETRARGSLEVQLAQFVKPAKVRRSKPAGEFEIVPSIPVVIALDDRLADDAELDEPWEHISADELDEKRAAPPSYATVVASTA